MTPKTRKHYKVITISIIVALSILIFDFYLPLDVAAGVPYVALVLIGLWSPWRYYVYLMAIFGTVFTGIGYFISPEGGEAWVALADRLLAVFAIWITAFLSIRIYDSELNLRSIVDTAAEGIVTINSKGLIMSFNKAAEIIFGYTADEVKGINVSILMPSPDSEMHDKYIKNYLESGEKKIIGIGREVFGKRRDGSVFPLHLAVSEVQYGNQRIFTGIMHDITKEKKAEVELRKLSKIAEQIPASIIITDINGNIEYINPKFTQLTGYTLDEVYGKNPRILKSGETPQEEYKELWETILSGNEWQSEIKNKKKNGELFWESVSISPVKNPTGDITHFIAVKEDITERKRTENALRESTELLTTIIQSQPESIMRLTKDGVLLDMNPAGLKLIEADTFEQIRGMSIYDLIIPEDQDKFNNLNKKIFNGESATLKYEIKSLNGSRRIVETHSVPLLDSNGNVIAQLGLTRDITDQVEKEKQLVHAMKMEAIGRLTGNIAHDFNNLLTIILGNLDLIKEKIKTEPELVDELIDDAFSASRDGAELTEGMLSFSRKQAPQPKQINVNTAIKDFTQLVNRMLGESIKLKTDFSKDDLWIMSDPIQLDSVLLNLAINSRDAMPDGGELTIKTERKVIKGNAEGKYSGLKPGNYVSVIVTDTGIGMEPEVMEHALEPFFTTKQVGMGSGLGLSTAYSFTDQNSGKLLIESTPGKGTTITMILREITMRSEDYESENNQETVPTGSETILVVEDKKLVRKFVARTLKGIGYQVLEANDASDAIQKLKTNNKIALLFSDIVMPGDLNGYELANQAIKLNSKLKILLTTGFYKEMLSEKNDNQQKFPLLKKPYSVNELAKKVRIVLDNL